MGVGRCDVPHCWIAPAIDGSIDPPYWTILFSGRLGSSRSHVRIFVCIFVRSFVCSFVRSCVRPILSSFQASRDFRATLRARGAKGQKSSVLGRRASRNAISIDRALCVSNHPRATRAIYFMITTVAACYRETRNSHRYDRRAASARCRSSSRGCTPPVVLLPTLLPLSLSPVYLSLYLSPSRPPVRGELENGCSRSTVDRRGSCGTYQERRDRGSRFFRSWEGQQRRLPLRHDDDDPRDGFCLRVYRHCLRDSCLTDVRDVANYRADYRATRNAYVTRRCCYPDDDCVLIFGAHFHGRFSSPFARASARRSRPFESARGFPRSRPADRLVRVDGP